MYCVIKCISLGLWGRLLFLSCMALFIPSQILKNDLSFAGLFLFMVSKLTSVLNSMTAAWICTNRTHSLKAASEKREAMEKKLRAKLEEELKDLRAEKSGGRLGSRDDTGMDELREKFSQAEEKVGKSVLRRK